MTILNEQSQTIVKSNVNFNSDVEYTVFQSQYNKDDRFLYINVSDGTNTSEHCIYSFELTKALQAINNNDFETLISMNEHIGKAFKSFYNYTFINEAIINDVAKILNMVLSNHEIELYNQDFENTRDNLFEFTAETFNNNWFYCLCHVPTFNADFTNEMIVREIVRYYVKVFIECAIDCQSDVADFY